MSNIAALVERYLYWLSLPDFKPTDFVEIFIIAFLVYEILAWIKNTKAWMLLRGIIIISAFVLVAWIFHMTTILWLVQKSVSILAIMAVVVFQPELRRALEKLGEKNLISSVFGTAGAGVSEGRFTDNVITEIVRACFEMGKNRTGALIVVEQNIKLREFERTGIMLDSLVSSQLLLNIFEHNTPLHDGAIIIRGNRIVAATCYLPLSDNRQLSKDLGTRHRAGLGMSEVSDALTIIVSEETGSVSYAFESKLVHGVTPEKLKEQLVFIQNKPEERKGFRLWKKGRNKHAETAEQ